jgi:hypothetical protein
MQSSSIASQMTLRCHREHAQQWPPQARNPPVRPNVRTCEWLMEWMCTHLACGLHQQQPQQLLPLPLSTKETFSRGATALSKPCRAQDKGTHEVPSWPAERCDDQQAFAGIVKLEEHPASGEHSADRSSRLSRPAKK